MKKQQLFRFCLYGFLKNQIYFKPFLILVFLEKGFSFLDIGFLISFRALSINLLEIPSGAAADVWGRRRSMILSMSGYIASFILFALVKKYWIFFPAMFLFAIGEAFRTGTHKAMIFDWLRHQGCEEKKTEIYGLTRSWSKIGSAINAWIAAGIVIYTKNYIWIFWASIIPYALNIVNFTFYPDFLDGSPKKKHNINQIVMVLKGGLKLCVKKIDLRNLILQNICFEGFYSIAKEYLQPLIKIAVLTTPIMLAMPEKNRTAILIALIYSLLNIMGSIASRKSHQISKKVGSEEKFSGFILLSALGIYLLITLGMFFKITILPIIGFIFLGVMLNLWKPVFVSLFYDKGDKETVATTLSIANQSKTLSIAFLAPLLGWLVDKTPFIENSPESLLPVAIFGICFSFLGFLIYKNMSN